MTRPLVRRMDVYQAVKFDMRLHGFRFIFLEFLLVGLGAVALTIVELLHAANGLPSRLGGIWFLRVSLNCLAVVILALQARRLGTSTTLSDRRVHRYALEFIVMLLSPLAVTLAALQHRHAGDFRSAPSSSAV